MQLDFINPGQYFAKQFAEKIKAEKVLVQKSGYFSRAAAASVKDLNLIKSCVDTAVESSLAGLSGVVGHDEDKQGIMRACEFARIKGGKPFDTKQDWFDELLSELGQPKGDLAAVH